MFELQKAFFKCNIDKIDEYDQKLKDEMVSAVHRSERTDIFFGKDLSRKHFFDKYPMVELSAIRKRFRKKATDSCKTLPI